MHEQAIAIFCICDEVVKSNRFPENSTCKMTNAEIMTFALIPFAENNVTFELRESSRDSTITNGSMRVWLRRVNTHLHT